MRQGLRISVLAALAIAILTLPGCGGESLEEGRIIDKQYQEGLTTTMVFPIPITCGTTCTTVIMVPYVVYDDPDWILWLEKCERDPESGERDCKHGEVYVDESTFAEWEEGDWFNADRLSDGASASGDDPVDKRGEA